MINFLPQKRLYRHLIFWVGVLLYFYFTVSIGPDYTLHPPLLYAIAFTVGVLHTYTFLYFVFPVFLAKKYFNAIVRYLFLTIVFCYFYKAFLGFGQTFIDPILHNQAIKPFDYTILKGFFLWDTWFLEYSTVIAVLTIYKLLINWQQKNRESEALERAKISTELQLIKAQINPNFLFSSLENLYELTAKKSKLSPEIVLKLSQVLSYLLYESQADEVPLEREIEMMENYCFLEKQRLGDKIDISLNFTGKIENKQIAPLILLPFLENAFKNTLDHQNEQAWISIDLSVLVNLIKFKIINGKNVEQKEAILDLEKVKKRLEYLYKNCHEIKIISDEETLFVGLTLELNKAKTPPKQKYHETTLPFG